MNSISSLQELQYEQELLENIPVEDIRKMFDGEVLFWVRGSAASSVHPEGTYYALLDYKGNVRYLEGKVSGGTAYASILAGILDGVKQLKSPVRFHIISPTDLFFESAVKPGSKSQSAEKVKEILHELKQKNCQLSYSRADGDALKNWIMSYCPNPPEPKENKYRRMIYKECLQKVVSVLYANGAPFDLIKKVEMIGPDE